MPHSPSSASHMLETVNQFNSDPLNPDGDNDRDGIPDNVEIVRGKHCGLPVPTMKLTFPVA